MPKPLKYYGIHSGGGRIVEISKPRDESIAPLDADDLSLALSYRASGANSSGERLRTTLNRSEETDRLRRVRQTIEPETDEGSEIFWINASEANGRNRD
jgi:hypothetical protein